MKQKKALDNDCFDAYAQEWSTRSENYLITIRTCSPTPKNRKLYRKKNRKYRKFAQTDPVVFLLPPLTFGVVVVV